MLLTPVLSIHVAAMEDVCFSFECCLCLESEGDVWSCYILHFFSPAQSSHLNYNYVSVKKIVWIWVFWTYSVNSLLSNAYNIMSICALRWRKTMKHCVRGRRRRKWCRVRPLEEERTARLLINGRRRAMKPPGSCSKSKIDSLRLREMWVLILLIEIIVHFFKKKSYICNAYVFPRMQHCRLKRWLWGASSNSWKPKTPTCRLRLLLCRDRPPLYRKTTQHCRHKMLNFR